MLKMYFHTKLMKNYVKNSYFTTQNYFAGTENKNHEIKKKLQNSNF